MIRLLSTFLGISSLIFMSGCSTENLQGKEMNQKKVVRYSDFGAVGDGKTDDFEAIVKAHEYANKEGLPVKADDNATYYIGGKKSTAIIQTDTDFGKAKFIIDDRKLENRSAAVFKVTSKLESFELKEIKSLKRDQRRIDVNLPGKCLITVKDYKVKQYIRYGNNQNNGASKTDIFLVDSVGNVDMQAPIIWDFDNISEIRALPLDKEKLTIRGGKFTTIANQAESKYTYHARNISVRRSRVEVIGLEHYIEGEGETGAPYSGFINISGCAEVTVRDSVFSGHKTYKTIGSAGRPVSMGTYDILPTKSVNVSFINCRQANDIRDRSRWGVMASNYCKNITYDKCKLSRFDAHKGVANAAIRDSVIGHAGINAIGSGKLIIEGSKVYGGSFVNMRQDYGSTWQGEFIFRNCVFEPRCGGSVSSVNLISGRNEGHHYFGYKCYMPERILFENLKILDSKHTKDYKGPAIFADFNRKLKDKDYKEKFPIVRSKEVILKNVTTQSGKPIRLSDNKIMFQDVKLKKIDMGK